MVAKTSVVTTRIKVTDRLRNTIIQSWITTALDAIFIIFFMLARLFEETEKPGKPATSSKMLLLLISTPNRTSA
jgi:ABC-type Fe3+ transport system permease subunit